MILDSYIHKQRAHVSLKTCIFLIGLTAVLRLSPKPKGYKEGKGMQNITAMQWLKIHILQPSTTLASHKAAFFLETHACSTAEILEGNVGSPNLGFSYFNFLGEAQWKKHPVSEAERKAADKPAKKHILEKVASRSQYLMKSIFQVAEKKSQ